MKFVVTGGAGFVGSNLVKLLVNEGHTVIVIDNLVKGKKSNLESVLDKIKFYEIDIRDSISVELIKKLLVLKNKSKIIIYDPKAMNNTKKLFEDKIRYAKSISESIKNSKIIILMVNWKEFQGLNNNSFKKSSRVKIIDCRRILADKKFDADYYAIGIGRE